MLSLADISISTSISVLVYTRRFDLPAATKMAWDTLKWRRSFQGIGVDNVTEELIANEIATGKAFLHKALHAPDLS